MASFRIDTTIGRGKLPPRREPYFARVAAGEFIGFRKLGAGEGTWVARWRDDEGKQHYHALDHQPDYDAAVRAARVWFAQCENASPRTTTVAAACTSYVKDRRIRKGEATAKDVEGRFNRHVHGTAFGRIDLGKLRSADIENWLGNLVKKGGADPDAERRSKDSANRNLATLKAALNFAFRSGLAASDSPWRRVMAFANVARRRERFLTLVQRRRLYAAASPELKRLLRAMALTAARPGELASAPVGAFDPEAGTLTLFGKTGRRTVPLSTDSVKFFKECARGKTAAAPLVARDDQSAWHRFAWRDAMQEAVKAALLPGDAVLYSMRHAAISEMLTAGLDPLSVARLAGTSVEMISKHYGHLAQEHVRKQLEGVRVL